jgi:dephospho-CoA kinase
MHVFGLTGGIACGKSAVAAHLRKRGVPVIDADALAREVVAVGTDGLREIIEAFGPRVLASDGSLDRKALAAIVFTDDAKRKMLEHITHPRIGALGASRVQALAAEGHPLACYEAALLIENRLQDAFRPLVVVVAPKHVQIARIRARDGATEDEARARIEAQMSNEEKAKLADFVIANAGTLEDLEARTDEVLAAIRARVASGTKQA